jgi:hypothetical protein
VPEWLNHHDPLSIGLEGLCFKTEKFSEKCLNGLCGNCGFDKMTGALHLWAHDDPSEQLQWKEWSKEPMKVKEKIIKRMHLVYKNGSRMAIVNELKKS